MQDPVSGAHAAEEIHRRFDGISSGWKIVEMNGVGHYPMVEDPEGVVKEVVSFFYEG